MRKVPVEKVSEETMRDLERRFEEYRSGKTEVVSGEEAVMILKKMAEEE
ncbi:addiction module protein [Thermococcus sp.]